ncbi:hypothetical protein D3C86_1801400 [compost metagenome]
MVRATFSARCVLRADQPSRAAACCSSWRAGPSSTACVSIARPCSAWFAWPWRCSARSRAPTTRARMLSVDSPAGASSSCGADTAATSMCRSMRSSSGPLSLPW